MERRPIMENCIFCKIIHGEIPSKKVYENEYCYAFYDIQPQAQTHILVVCKQHTPNIVHAVTNHAQDVLECMKAVANITQDLGLDKTGFRLITNCGKNACQSVEHLHFHILGGQALADKMG